MGAARAPISILLVGRPLVPVGPDAAGGAEQVIAALDEAIVAAGHRSVVIAPEGSVCQGRLCPTPRVSGPLDERARDRAARRHRSAVARALRDFRADLVHMHGADFDRYLPDEGPPVLVTLRAPPASHASLLLRIDRPATFVHGVSAAHTAALPEEAFLLPEIVDGVRIDHLRFRAQKRRFALALGAIRPEKGFHVALDAAARAGVPILLAGPVPPGEANARYFREAIAPRLGPRVMYAGLIDAARKRRVLAAARCVIVPALAAAPSSIVAMEALASGTPVIAFRRGGLPEIVEHGVTGYLVADVDEMAEAMAAVETLDPGICRRAAEDRFSADRMARAYLSRYEGVLTAARCAAALAQHGGDLPKR